MQQHQQYTSDGSQAAMMKQDPAMPAATAAGAGAGAMNGSGAGVPGYNQEQKQEFGAQRPANAWKFECLDVFSDMDLCESTSYPIPPPSPCPRQSSVKP